MTAKYVDMLDSTIDSSSLAGKSTLVCGAVIGTRRRGQQFLPSSIASSCTELADLPLSLLGIT